MKIELKEKKLFIDGKETLLMCGEIHYFRLDPKDWEDRIIKLKESGFNSIATYIPWSIHEQTEGNIDLLGKTKPQYNLLEFLKLIKKYDLYFVLRPGPFIMAETIGEGVPNWLKQKHPEIVPNTWNGNKTPNQTVDYLSPNFLKYTKVWYEELFKLVKTVEGLKLTSIQLDNEIGMLAWVSNSPDLTEVVAEDMSEFIKEKNLENEFTFDTTNKSLLLENLQKPNEEDEVMIHNTIGNYNRNRFDKYIELLKSFIEETGIINVPYMINIHGTGAERLFGYPIGISQLYKTYTGKSNFIAGSDLYFGNIDLSNFHELYLANAMTEATLDGNQVLSALEFNATSGDYSNSIANRRLTSSLEIQSKIMLAQNNKIINFYLFTGGYNDFQNTEQNDGRSRIASTGELHGYGAPLDPYGKKAYFYDAIDNVGKLSQELNEKLAKLTHKKDKIAMAFIPDYYMTEYCHPESLKVRAIYDNIIKNRAEKFNDTLVKYALIRGYQPDMINIQDNQIPNDIKLLMVPSAKYMDKKVQENIVAFLEKGNKIFLVGEVPCFDLLGNTCTILKDYMQVEEVSFEAKQYLSAVPTGYLKGNVTSFIWDASAIKSELNNTPLLELYDPKVNIALHIKDKFEAVIWSCNYRVDFESFDKVFSELGIKPSLKLDTDEIGLYTFVLENNGEKLLNIINLDENERKVKMELDGVKLFDDKQICVAPRETKIVPVDIKFDKITVLYSTEEILKVSDSKITFKLNANESLIKVASEFNITCDLESAKIKQNGNIFEIEIKDRKVSQKEVTLTINE